VASSAPRSMGCVSLIGSPTFASLPPVS